MRNYSVRYLDALGRTQTSEFLPFEDNKLATDYARIGMIRSPIVEVWRGDDLVARLFQQPREIHPVLHIGDPASTAAIVHADRRATLEEWDNEGGGASRRPSEGFRH
jgi:hypothetical protein